MTTELRKFQEFQTCSLGRHNVARVLTRPSTPGESTTGATAIGREFCPGKFDRLDARLRAHFRPESSGNCSRLPRAVSPTIRRAPQHIADTGMWGVSDPAERRRGHLFGARAGSLTPLPCCDTCAGALSGRHKPPPVPIVLSDGNIVSFKGLRRLGNRSPAGMRGEPGTSAVAGRGPTAPWPCVPLLGPFVGVRTVMWTTMVEFQLTS